MDELQLKLCDIQGRLFELSGTQEIPSEAFIKAFMTSETAKALDSTYNRMQWMGEEYLLEEVKDAAGDILTASGEIFQGDILSASGEIFQADVLYWIGYLYRYWHYYTGEPSNKILRQAPIETMKRNYLMFHTMAPELAIEDLKEIHAQKK